MSRLPTPNRQQFPSAPLIQSHQPHIEERGQSTGTLEAANKRLRDTLTAEQTRAKEAIHSIEIKWHAEKTEWETGVEELHSLHRIAHLRTISQLEGEKVRVLKERDKIRQARIQTAETAFQVCILRWRETELMAKVEELEDEVEEVRLEGEENLQELMEQCQSVVDNLKAKCRDFAQETKQKTKELEKALKEKDKVDDKLSRLQAQQTSAASNSNSLNSRLERTMLQLDGAKTANTELERVNDDLKRSHAELKRQLDKWQHLETKGEVAAEDLRQRRIELELRVKELENKLGGAEQRAEEAEGEREKVKKKLEKAKEAYQAWKNEAANKAAEAVESNKNFEKAQKQIEKLKAQLESERARVRPLSPHKSAADVVASESEISDQGETIKTKLSAPVKPLSKAQSVNKPASTSGGRPQPKPAFKGSKTKATSSENAGMETGRIRKTAKGMNAEESDVELLEPSEKSKGKRKAEEVESDVEVVEKKGKRKAVNDGDTVRKRKGSKVDIDQAEGKKRSSKPSGSRIEDGDENNGNDPPKKKRKINLFPPSQTPTMPWGQFAQGDGGLNIPTALSPVKESGKLPARANSSSSILGRVGSVFSSSFGRN